ncbi:hypothetical protein [Acidovorax sp. SUPP3334]|uniref:hypothetical protein n=1 Tax=Acidovorax sp. SUPP3334 TaxID=2920881 RepID=UPI0023DE228E|nr:hypothetical protein [Acidovorax sp. SUPP3334]GKT22298.1 hypothetical protein AVHM3334_07875 [Acidovorax sp. SUPP3334]
MPFVAGKHRAVTAFLGRGWGRMLARRPAAVSRPRRSGALRNKASVLSATLRCVAGHLRGLRWVEAVRTGWASLPFRRAPPRPRRPLRASVRGGRSAWAARLSPKLRRARPGRAMAAATTPSWGPLLRGGGRWR